MISLIILIGGVITYLAYKGYVEHPKVEKNQLLYAKRFEVEKNFFILGNNKLRKSDSDHWELYIEGKPYDRGIIIGKLTAELFDVQEKAFKKEIRRYVPNGFYMQVLMVIIAWINRNISNKIPKEYCLEIFGIADSLGLKFFFRNYKYFKILNYHAAHDIGHALANLNLVGCTSLSVNNSKTLDGKSISGRNFDFHFGDDFSKEKIIAFYAPSEGYKFAMITWGGMIGTLSGMNINGLCVTVNGAKSHLPKKVSTPVSLLVREILQYASNIDEAYVIASKRKIIMSEAIMVTSTFDKKAVLIEKSEKNTVIFDSKDDILICTNHLQSQEFFNDKVNQENIAGGSTQYRFDKVTELISEKEKLGINDLASILRNRDGLNGKDIGLGNEKVINQLIAHHSIIFKPDELKFWVSTQHCSLGEFVCYDLNKVFDEFPKMKESYELYEKELTIPKDDFIEKGYDKYQEYRKMLSIFVSLKKTDNISEAEIKHFVSLNPEFYFTYYAIADYYYKRKNFDKASDYYSTALEKEVTFMTDKDRILRKLEKIKKA
jgi:tetratricopeptide (TPR) repeat protein